MPSDGSPTIDQLRTFVAVVDAGGFSGAAKRLGRSQPAVSYAMAALEEQLGLALFKRGRRSPVLTDAGAAILAYARRICLLGDELQASASNLTGGLEGVVSIAIDSFFPRARLTAAMKDFAANFPSATPHLFVGSRDAVLERVLDRESVIGISATDIAWPSGIEARDFGAVTIVAVAARMRCLNIAARSLPRWYATTFRSPTSRPARPTKSVISPSIRRACGGSTTLRPPSPSSVLAWAGAICRCTSRNRNSPPAASCGCGSRLARKANRRLP